MSVLLTRRIALRQFPCHRILSRLISSNDSSNKDIDDKILNQWKEGIQKREELKKTLAEEEHKNFIETKKKQLEDSRQSSEKLQQLINSEKDKYRVEQEEPVASNDELKVSGSYQQLVKKIKDNENFQQLREELKKYGENHKEEPAADKSYKEHLSDRLKNNAQELKNAFPIVLRIVNELTGYTKVENLKKDITLKEMAKQELKEQLKVAKANYNKSIELRSMSQKQINELLQRQNSWSLEDLERFTELYKNDHILEKQEHENMQLMQELELKKDENDEKLTTSILTRYHEEQVWSDKIRKFSTWGTILIMGVNLLLFILVQLVFEPFKRKRLVNAFELKVKELLDDNISDAAPLIKESIRDEKELLDEIVEIENTIKEKDTEVVSFKLPKFDRYNINQFVLQLLDNLKTNFLKLFGTGSKSLVIDKIQLNVLLGVGVLTSFSIGLLF